MKPKKSLGQNFLTNKKAILEMVKAGEIKKGDTILEIGPGKGALTEELLKTEVKIIAIEKDKDLVSFLIQKFEKEINEKQLILLEKDILNVEIKNLEKEIGKEIKSYKLIANIPYYITGAIIEKFLSIEKKPEKMALLVQKEVAERIVARDKKESILSLAVKFYGEPKFIYRVSAGSFFPKPKVDSAILAIKINKKIEKKEIETLYFQILKKAFAFKRKYMLSNLKKGLPDYKWEDIFDNLNLDKKARAEDLNLEIFLKIVNRII